jgi:hypothetical protein
MSRSLSSATVAAATATSGISFHLIRLGFRDLTGENELYINTSSQNFVTSGVSGIPDEEWLAVGVGGTSLGLGAFSETNDFAAQALELSLDGVDQSIIAVLNNNFFRSQPIDIWRVWINPSTGQVAASILMFSGLQNDEYTISESRSGNNEDVQTCSVSTRVMSSIAYLQRANEILMNTDSHNAYLRRAGVTTRDDSFKNVTEIVGRDILWGGPGRSYKFLRKISFRDGYA